MKTDTTPWNLRQLPNANFCMHRHEDSYGEGPMAILLSEKVIELKGLKIGRQSVAGANAVVTQEMSHKTLAVGIPVSPIRRVKCDQNVESGTKAKWG